MNPIAKRFADNANSESSAAALRRKRVELFLSFVKDLPRPLRVLDLGGTEKFWQRSLGEGIDELQVTLLNLQAPTTTLQNFTAIAGDARDLAQFTDDAFDVVFSNSVIEHVGHFEDQRRMANEMQRVGKRYFIQTPNRYFPIEPHFLLPYFQYYPTALRIALAKRFALGYSKEHCKDTATAREYVTRITLLNHREVRELFPNATIYKEPFAGLTKSFIAYGPVS